MQSEQAKQRLMARRQELAALSAIAEESRGAVELDQSKVGRLSRMDAMQQQEMAKASEVHRSQELRRIDAAMVRIAAGDYGYCVQCDEAIAPKRLEIDPAVALCIDCAGGGG